MTREGVYGSGLKPVQKLVMLAGYDTRWDVTAMAALLGWRLARLLNALARLRECGAVDFAVMPQEEKTKEKTKGKETEKETEKEKRKEAKEINKEIKKENNQIKSKEKTEAEEPARTLDIQSFARAQERTHARTDGEVLQYSDRSRGDDDSTNTIQYISVESIRLKASESGRKCSEKDAERIARHCNSGKVSDIARYAASCIESLPPAQTVTASERLKAKRDAEDASFRAHRYRVFTVEWLRDFMSRRFLSREKMLEYVSLSMQDSRKGLSWVFDYGNSLWGEYGGYDDEPLNALRDRTERGAGVAGL